MSKKPTTEASLIAKGHTHIIPGTLRYDAQANKNKITIRTRGINGQFDGNTREIATSDLHQTFWTVETKQLIDAAKRQSRRAIKGNTLVRKPQARKINPDLEVFVVMDEEEYAALQAA